MIKTIPYRIYKAFIEDTVRLYRVMPKMFRKHFWFIQFLQLVLAITESCTVLMLSFFGASMASPKFTKSTFFVKKIFSWFPKFAEFCADDRVYIVFICALVLLFIIFKNVLTYLSMSWTTKFAEGLSAYIGEVTLEKYLNKDYFWHISSESANIMQKLNFRGSLAMLAISLLQFYSNIICSFILFVSLFIAEPKLTLLVVFVFSIISSMTYLGVRKKVDAAGKKSTEIGIEENATMMAILRGMREIILYRQQKQFLANITSSIKKSISPRAFLSLVISVPAWFLEVTGFSIIFGVLIYMVNDNAQMPEIIAAVSMLMLTAWRVLPAVSRSMNLAVTIRSQRPMALSCLELLETFIAQDSEPQPEPSPDFKFEKDITLKDVSFRYPDAPEDSLSNINLTIKKGSKIGLVGFSGAGKSTLALLLSGLMPLKSGEILIDDIPLDPQLRAAYCQHIGFVPQSPFLVEGTIADNIAFSKWGQKYDRKAVENACQKAAMNFIFNYPNGIDSVINSSGGGLSGGQAQRVSIARALFVEPDIIIFDEATSALDQANENIVISTLNNLSKNATVVIIAHRMSTVEKCDRIIWIDNGCIVADGHPNEILPLYVKSLENHREEQDLILDR